MPWGTKTIDKFVKLLIVKAFGHVLNNDKKCYLVLMIVLTGM